MKKKIYFAVVVIACCSFIIGCGKTKGIVYEGTVKEVAEPGSNQLLLESLVPVEEKSDAVAFEEVILLTEGVKIISKETKKEVKVDDIEVGTELKVTLSEQAITATSMPPQIPGGSILEIQVP